MRNLKQLFVSFAVDIPDNFLLVLNHSCNAYQIGSFADRLDLCYAVTQRRFKSNTGLPVLISLLRHRLDYDGKYSLIKGLQQLKGHEAVLQISDGDFLQDVPLSVPVAQKDQQLARRVPGLHQGDAADRRRVYSTNDACSKNLDDAPHTHPKILLVSFLFTPKNNIVNNCPLCLFFF